MAVKKESTVKSPAESLLDEISTWPKVTTRTTSRGATAIDVNGHELGHVHLNRRMLDMPLPDDRRTAVLKAGRAKEWFEGWITKPLTQDADARDGIALLRGSYEAALGSSASETR